MKTKIFYFSPTLLPDSDAAAVRNGSFIKELTKSFDLQVYSYTTNLFFKLFSNKKNAYQRLYGEIMSGFELFFKCLSSPCKHFFFSSPPFIAVLTATYAVRLKRGSYVIDVRDIYPEVFFDSGIIKKDSLTGQLAEKLTSEFYMHADLVVTTSQGQKNAVLRLAPRAKVTVVYNGFDPEIFKLQKQKASHFSIAFHGNLGKFQRIDILVEVARRIGQLDQEIRFIVAGDGPGAEIIEQAHLPNLEYLGKIAYEKIPAIIGQCHLGLSFRTDDEVSLTAMPVKGFEYLGVGIPCILTPKGEAADLFEKLKIGIGMNNQDIESIVQMILRLKNDPSLYDSYVEKISLIRDDFSRKGNAEFLRQEIEAL